MSNLTNKNLQRMRELMGNKKPINESKLISAVELIKKSPDGKFYGVVRENKKYFIKESSDGSNFDFIGGVANKGKHQFESYEQAVRRLNLMVEDTDVLRPDLIEEKRFVIKSKKKSEPSSDTFDFGGSEKGGDESLDFDFGGDSEGGDSEESDSLDFDFGGDSEERGDDSLDIDLDSEDSDEDLSDEDDPIKGIQKMTGKLGQKIRDTEDLSSDTMKWVAKSIISALDLDAMDSEDKKDIIRAVKKDEDEGSDEEFDFMEDTDCVDCDGSGFDEDMENCVNCGGTGQVEDSDMVDWNNLSDEEKSNIVNTSIVVDEEPMVDWDSDDQIGRFEDPARPNSYRRDDDSQYMLFDPEEVDYMSDEEEYGPGEPTYRGNEVILDDELPYYEDEYVEEYSNEDWMSDDETYPYYEANNRDDNEDYMSKFAGDVKRNLRSGGRNLEVHELDTHLRKIRNKIGGRTTHIDNDMVVGDFGFIKVTNNGYELHKEGERFPRTFRFDELGKIKQALSDVDYMDYMEDDILNPAPAPTKPSTKPDVKPGKPGTDKPSPSKRPFTPPPHITPGEEPGPKAEEDIEDGYDFMDDDTCPSCEGTGSERGNNIGFRTKSHSCQSCGGTGRIKDFVGDQHDIDSEEEISEPYTDNPFGYRSSTTLPNGLDYNYDYREDVTFPFRVKNVDYMSDFDDTLASKNKRSRPMNPAPAPTKPSTKPDVKPGKPGTDKPTPSKRPFTPPPHITPGEEPGPKARKPRF